MAGLISVGNNIKSNALSGMRRLSDLERAREEQEKRLDMADAADHKSNQMMGAGMGMAAGWQIGAKAGSYWGPVGTIVGAAVGYLAGSLF